MDKINRMYRAYSLSCIAISNPLISLLPAYVICGKVMFSVTSVSSQGGPQMTTTHDAIGQSHFDPSRTTIWGPHHHIDLFKTCSIGTFTRGTCICWQASGRLSTKRFSCVKYGHLPVNSGRYLLVLTGICVKITTLCKTKTDFRFVTWFYLKILIIKNNLTVIHDWC